MDDADAQLAVELRLIYEREVFINPPVTRQWVSIKVFALPGDVEDQTALAWMIAHVRYRDSYASSTFVDAKTIHGPYQLSAITPHVFIVADSDDVDALIRTWSACYVRWPDADVDAMQREVYARTNQATVIYQLPDIRATARHDWGDVVGRDGFHEFVIIDRAASELALLVASDD
ncbi:hypothetical protein FHT40_006122 [Mycolicibacterium sp. BK556]|uniref:hypothetical protein n=1 Tax=unclassified Mycolicibacterium TaxID=2636767 RepID=UPI00160D7D0C|nr:MULTISPECIES: hypothetical protein [unclassified Mycolicibacterium]MBB3606431.1 hypothetical protein [Mycolicibacterium sp. BK556]MBB3636323.1 hypothetical protein [Mycolicibacterium sp. BK607]